MNKIKRRFSKKLPPEVLYYKELQELKKFSNDLRWFQDNYQNLKKQFKGEYVAVKEARVVDHDKDYHLLLKRLRGRYPDLHNLVVEHINEQKKVFVL